MTKYEELWLIYKTKHTDECVTFTGATTPAGYPVIKLPRSRKMMIASRLMLSWVLDRQLTKTEQACHSCDNPACVNPKHLFVGTAKDNVHDMIDKGRQDYSSLTQRKLNDDERLAIRDEYKQGGVTMRDLGNKYGITNSTVHYIVHEYKVQPLCY